MTRDQFQTRYHDFMTADRDEAGRTAAEVNAIGVEGETIVVGQFGAMYCLMLQSAFDFVSRILAAEDAENDRPGSHGPPV
jgi:hypothetical protein